MEVNIKTGRLVSTVMGKPAACVFNLEENPEERYSKFLQTVGNFYKTTWYHIPEDCNHDSIYTYTYIHTHTHTHVFRSHKRSSIVQPKLSSTTVRQ
jgi:hypothetical protein